MTFRLLSSSMNRYWLSSLGLFSGIWAARARVLNSTSVSRENRRDIGFCIEFFLTVRVFIGSLGFGEEFRVSVHQRVACALWLLVECFTSQIRGFLTVQLA